MCCDDWLVIGQFEDDRGVVCEFVLDLLQKLGFENNRFPYKCKPVCTALTWLRLQLDSRNVTIVLPSDEVSKALSLVRDVLVAKSITRLQLDSLFGYLSFCSTVVIRGQAFLHCLRRLFAKQEGCFVVMACRARAIKSCM